jgi:hypothetical protein
MGLAAIKAVLMVRAFVVDAFGVFRHYTAHNSKSFARADRLTSGGNP